MISLHKAISIMKLVRLGSCWGRPGSVHTESRRWGWNVIWDWDWDLDKEVLLLAPETGT